MGEQPTKEASVNGSKTAPLQNNASSNSNPASTTQGPPKRADGKDMPGLLGLRRAIPTLRSRSGVGKQTVEHSGKLRQVIISGVVLTFLLTFLMTAPLLPGQVQIEPGMPTSQDIFAPGFIKYESKVQSEKARQEAANDPTNDVWVQDINIVRRQKSLLESNLSVVDAMRINANIDAPSQVRRQPVLQGITVTQEILDLLVTLPDNDYAYWRNSNVLIAYDAMMRDRRLAGENDVAAARSALPDRLAASLTPDQKAAAVAFIAPLITINMSLDQEQTDGRRKTAIDNVKPVIQTVQKGEVILRQGDLATPETVEKMQEAGLLRRDVSALTVLSTGALVGMLMLLMHLYMYRYSGEVWRRRKQVLLVGLLIVGTVAVARLFLPGHSVLPYLLPVAAVSMLIAVLINTNLAVLVTVVLAVLTGLVATGNNLSIELPLYYFVGGLAGIFSLTRVEKVNTFAVAGASIAVASFLTTFSLRALVGTPIDWTLLQTLALEAVFVGGVAATITYASFSALGTLFGITTPLQLMELAHPDQPVLRRMMQEAPGTYHHSLVVSNLAERAAEMIGADALLTRVCAYYHDIGKVVKPYHFIDNQTGMKNIHDELPPRESAAIIAGHVTDGIELGKKNRLPRRVLDAIPQHHGTMLIKYFYIKALKDDPNANPDDFRYPGPKPQTKENAILMLADGVEATVRAMAQAGALDKPQTRNSDASESPGLYNDMASLPEDAVANIVHKTINERIEDGQLDECDLTVRDIARIQEAFVSMLKGIYHPRVQYPDAPKADDRRPTTDDERTTTGAPGNGGEITLAASAATNGHTNGTNGVGQNGAATGDANGRRSAIGSRSSSGQEEPAGV